MKICSSCGADIKPGAVKCSCCGCLVEDVAMDSSERFANNKYSYTTPAAGAYYSAPPVTFAPAQPAAPAPVGKPEGCNIFAEPTWQSAWSARRMSAGKLGIILTNTGNAANVSAFMRSLNEYVAHKASQGIEYYLLDVNDQSVAPMYSMELEAVVSLLRTVYSTAVPDYLMIVGDSTVIPSADWYNECDDGDETVPSDLPYITLDTRSPWEGLVYDFENVTQVGRIPSKATNDFAEAVSYFENTKLFKGYTSAKSFAYSALVWEKTSRAEFSHLRPTLITSPNYTSSADTARARGLSKLEKLSPDYNLVCFNLHGSDGTHAWYGQEGSSYPEAFEKGLLPENGGYVLLTEACYGARPLAGASIVVNAIMNRCVAFVGSSRIAYGMSNGGISCADVIAQSFTSGVIGGMTVGNAFLSALTAISSGLSVDEEEIKTLAEFALYGDPSVVLISGVAKKSARMAEPAKLSAVSSDSTRGITLMSCSEGAGGRSAKNGITLLSFSADEQAHIKQMASRVSKTGNDYVLKKFSEMEKVEPKVYKVVGREEYRAVYSKNEGEIKNIVKMHLDGKGNVKKVYNSK